MDVAKRSVVSAVIVRRSFSLGTPSVDALEITPDRFSLIEKIDQSEPLFLERNGDWDGGAILKVNASFECSAIHGDGAIAPGRVLEIV